MSPENKLYQTEAEIKSLLESDDLEQLQIYCQKEHPADLAEALDLLELEEAQSVFQLLEIENQARVLAQCDSDFQEELMAPLDDSTLTLIMEQLPPDDAADAVGELEEDRAERVLSGMPQEDREELEDLLQYDEESAGGIMTPDVIAFSDTCTVSEVLEAFRGIWKKDQIQKEEWKVAFELIREENVYSIFVVDQEKKLKGLVRMQDLISTEPSTRLTDILNTEVVSVGTDEDQEEVAEIASKYDLASVAVVDQQGRLAGRVTIDDLVDVMEEEATEDILKMAGTTEDELVTMSPVHSLMLRLPWLMAALCGLLLSGYIFSLFGDLFGKVVQLAFFIPVIGGLSGNSGVQSSTIVVRGLSTGQIDISEYLELTWKEFRAGLLMGCVCGIIVSIAAYWLADWNVKVAASVGISIVVAVSWASLLGVLIPIFLAKIGKDPAVATGPLVTSLNDAVSAIIYVTVASILLNLGG